jgi:membrane protease YdiL (CAAX protease family)
MAAAFASAAAAVLILFFGQGAWTALLGVNLLHDPKAPPWSVLAMAAVLWLMWEYLGGRWWPRKTSETRRRCLRANAVSPGMLSLSFLAGVMAVVGLAGLWIVLFQLVRTPANVLADASKYPWLTVVLVTIMSSMVSPIVEEIAFRGYLQGTLERLFPAAIAVLFSSLLFMLAHLNHGWYWPKLTVYFLAGVVFGLIAWRTNSILASLPVHIVGDLTFFVLVWPRDAGRVLVSAGGADRWFWVHVAQAVIFSVAASVAFLRLVRTRSGSGLDSGVSEVAPISTRMV